MGWCKVLVIFCVLIVQFNDCDSKAVNINAAPFSSRHRPQSIGIKKKKPETPGKVTLKIPLYGPRYVIKSITVNVLQPPHSDIYRSIDDGIKKKKDKVDPDQMVTVTTITEAEAIGDDAIISVTENGNIALINASASGDDSKIHVSTKVIETLSDDDNKKGAIGKLHDDISNSKEDLANLKEGTTKSIKKTAENLQPETKTVEKKTIIEAEAEATSDGDAESSINIDVANLDGNADDGNTFKNKKEQALDKIDSIKAGIVSAKADKIENALESITSQPEKEITTHSELEASIDGEGTSEAMANIDIASTNAANNDAANTGATNAESENEPKRDNDNITGDDVKISDHVSDSIAEGSDIPSTPELHKSGDQSETNETETAQDI